MTRRFWVGWGGGGGGRDGRTMEREKRRKALSFFPFPLSHARILYVHEDRVFYTICTL